MATQKICYTCKYKMTRIKRRSDSGKKLLSHWECRNPKCGKK